MSVRLEGRSIPYNYNDMPNKSVLECSRKQNIMYEDGWCTFQTTVSVEKRVFMGFKCLEVDNFLETIRCFKRVFFFELE